MDYSPLSQHGDKFSSLLRLTHVIYGLQGFALIVVLPYFIAIIFNYVKKDEVKGTWLESHFQWQIRTFWLNLLWVIIGLFTLSIFVGRIILFATICWYIYRVLKGWLYLNDNKPIQ